MLRTVTVSAHRRRVGALALAWLIAPLAACHYKSDAQHATHQAAQRRTEAVRSMQLATAQTPHGTPVQGEALRQLVVEHTWISEYQRLPDGSPGPYRTYDYFRQDGQFIHAHNWVYGEAKAVSGDRWRVDGARLCIVHQHYTRDERCYTVALDAERAIQLYIDAPGEPEHGLLTRVIRRTSPGAPAVDAARTR